MATKKIDTMSNREIYIEYVNDFLTIEKMAEYYDVSPLVLQHKIKLGKDESEQPVQVNTPEPGKQKVFIVYNGVTTFWEITDLKGKMLHGGLHPEGEAVNMAKIKGYEVVQPTTVGELPEKLDVHSTGLLSHKAELHTPEDTDGIDILAEVQTMELANELTKRYNNYPALLREHEWMVKHDSQLQEQNRVLLSELKLINERLKYFRKEGEFSHADQEIVDSMYKDTLTAIKSITK